jgi:hypothetical protein
MKESLKKLQELSRPLKEALMKHYEPNCYHISKPKDIEHFKFYFANGYNTFSFGNDKNSKDNISVNCYAKRFDIGFCVSENDLQEFVKIVENAIELLNNLKENEKEIRINEKRQELLKQLKDLEYESN